MPGSETPLALLLLVAMLATLPLIAFVAGRLRLSYTVVVVVVGLAVSVPPFGGNVIEVSPELAVTLLLPGLVFEAAYRLDPRPEYLLNLAGAIVWSVAIAAIGYFSAGALELLLGNLRRYEEMLFLAIVVIGAIVWWLRRRRAVRKDNRSGDLQ